MEYSETTQDFGTPVDYNDLIKAFESNDIAFANKEELETILGKPLPVIYQGDKLWTTLYPAIDKNGKVTKATVVRTHKSPLDYGDYVTLTISGPRRIPAIIDKDAHGNPCQQQSLRRGGDPYPEIDFNFE